MIRFGPFEFDPAAGLLYQADEETLLPPKATAVLHELLKNAGELVSKDELLESVWEGSFVTESSLTDAVSLLRQVLSDDSRNPTYIQTLHRRGYRFIGDVEAGATEAPVADSEAAPSVEPDAPKDRGLKVGDRLGNYEILGTLGAGAMGTVYRARDLSLEREVAIKALPADFSDDPERVARLEREAKLLASVSHPNIASIHSLEEADGTKFPVFELVEGETLEQRLQSGRIKVDEALELARQIASALEAAHEQAVIHRDLKPANIKVTPEGQVKVLDFGLAKALEVKVFGADADESPTESIAVMGSRRGSIVGTAAYMSPEQARGQEIDKRADIWSFGSVLYEMLTGHRPFAGETVSDTIAGVLEREPDWDALPPETPALVRSLLRRLLQKNPAKRLHDVADARIEIEDALSEPEETRPGIASVAAQPFPRRRALPWGLAGTFAFVALLVGAWNLMSPAPTAPRPPMRFDFRLPPGVSFTSTGRHAVAVSPDGAHVAFSANNRLYARAMDDRVVVPLQGTDGRGRNPFFSPDSQWIGFWLPGQTGELWKVPTGGGPAVKLCDAVDYFFGASWGENDEILYGQDDKGIWRVSAQGGDPELLIEMAEGEMAHGPQLLPGGEWVLFTLLTSPDTDWDDAQIVVQSLATDERQLLVPEGRDARYLPTGHLVYALDDVLLARALDLSRPEPEVTGGPVPIVQGVLGGKPFSGAAHFDFSQDGVLAYIPSVREDRALVWVDRHGDSQPVTDQLRQYTTVGVSPKGEQIAVAITAEDGRDIWILEIEQNVLTALTTGHDAERFTWTPDGERVTYASRRMDGGADLYWMRADFSDQEAEQLFASEHFVSPAAWSPDGRTLVLGQSDQAFARSIIQLPFSAEGTPGTPSLVISSEYNELAPKLSPDGNWLAYLSDRSGQLELYVRPFPARGGQRVQVSDEGGAQPLWRPDGQELFYLSGDKVVAVAVKTEPSFEIVAREVLFEKDFYRRFPWATSYDIHPDGQRFLMVEETGAGQQVNIVLNWFEELKRLVPVRR